MKLNTHREYADVNPTQFTGLSSFDDWISKIPCDEIESGSASLFNDTRIDWLMQKCGGVKNLNILELGSFEAGHTFMLHRGLPRNIDAIEANRGFYLKSLCIKEVFRLKNANFYLGSFVHWLTNNKKHYDLIVASGILYHMTDPIGLLDLLSSNTNKLFIWTHYAPKTMYPDNHPLRGAYVGTELTHHKGSPITLYKRSYLNATDNPTFCGGVRDDHSWLSRDGILTVLRQNGFNHIETEDQLHNPNGPCFSLFAERRKDETIRLHENII